MFVFVKAGLSTFNPIKIKVKNVGRKNTRGRAEITASTHPSSAAAGIYKSNGCKYNHEKIADNIFYYSV